MALNVSIIAEGRVGSDESLELPERSKVTLHRRKGRSEGGKLEQTEQWRDDRRAVAVNQVSVLHRGDSCPPQLLHAAPGSHLFSSIIGRL